MNSFILSLTCTAAKNAHKPPMIPTSTHGKISHIVFPSDASVLSVAASGKKVLRQADTAVEWRVAETIAQAAPTANTATIAMMCKVR